MEKRKNNKISTSRRRLLTARRRRPAPAHRTRRFNIINSNWENRFNVRVVRLKREMKEISKDHELIGAQQREIGVKIVEIRDKCAKIRHESDQILKQQASNQVLLQLMFKILRARDNCDFFEAANATATLREMMGKKGKSTGEDGTGTGTGIAAAAASAD